MRVHFCALLVGVCVARDCGEPVRLTFAGISYSFNLGCDEKIEIPGDCLMIFFGTMDGLKPTVNGKNVYANSCSSSNTTGGEGHAVKVAEFKNGYIQFDCVKDDGTKFASFTKNVGRANREQQLRTAFSGHRRRIQSLDVELPWNRICWQLQELIN